MCTLPSTEGGGCAESRTSFQPTTMVPTPLRMHLSSSNMWGVCCSALVDSFSELTSFLTLGRLCSVSTTQMIFFCHTNLLWDVSFNLSSVQRGWTQIVSHQSQPLPRGCSPRGKGIIRSSALSSEDPSWVLLPGLLPIRMSGHGWRFINSVLLLEFLCCANLLLSDHFQQIYLASHVKLRQTLTN